MTADKFVVVCGLARSLLKFKIGPVEFYLFESLTSRLNQTFFCRYGKKDHFFTKKFEFSTKKVDFPFFCVANIVYLKQSSICKSRFS